MKPLYLAFLLITIFGCTSRTEKRTQLIDYVPKHNSLIIKTSNIEGLKNSINNNDFLSHFANTKTYKSLEQKLATVSYLKPNSDLLICLNELGKDNLEFTIVTQYHKNLFITDSLKNYSEERIKTNTISYNKSTIENTVFYNTVIDSIFVASSTKTQIEDVIKVSNSKHPLRKTYNTIDADKTLSFIFESDTAFVKFFSLEKNLSLENLTNHTAIDIDINQNQIFLNGITKSDDSLHLINVFKNTVPQENKIQQITPSNSDGFLSFTFDDYSKFQDNLNIYNSRDTLHTIVPKSPIFDNIIEVGTIYEGKNRAIVINSIDAIATNDALISEQSIIESYRGVDLFKFNNHKLFATHFAPLISFKNVTKYCQIDDFFVFADNLEMLENIIASYQNKTTLNNQSYFKSIKQTLSDEASILIVVPPPSLKTILKNNIISSPSSSFKTYKSSAIQFIYDSNFAHINGIIKKSKNRAVSNSVSEELNIKLDTEVLNTPQFVINHISKQKEIVVQDIKNNLYLISNRGKVLWKKRINGSILGKIEQIDMYKNGRLQLVFATPHHLYVLDRNGKEVSPFPLKFNDEITQPLSVFDYDKKKNYRLLVTQGKHILMYDAQGKTVKGFTFKSAKKPIINQPQHFRIGSKDYLTIKTKNKLYILDRTGKTRIKPKSSNTFSNEPLYLYNNKFTTTSSTGSLITIDTKGNIATQNLNLNTNHFITSTSKTLVSQSDNKLNIRNKTLNLDYGNYTKPKIFYINDKIYVTITDLQSHKTHLYDSQAKTIPNFPVYGNSSISLDNIDKDSSLEFVVKGDKNSILLYQIN